MTRSCSGCAKAHTYMPLLAASCPLDVLHYVLMRLPAPEGSLSACTPPVLLCWHVLALGSTNVGRSDLLPTDSRS